MDRPIATPCKDKGQGVGFACVKYDMALIIPDMGEALMTQFACAPTSVISEDKDLTCPELTRMQEKYGEMGLGVSISG